MTKTKVQTFRVVVSNPKGFYVAYDVGASGPDEAQVSAETVATRLWRFTVGNVHSSVEVRAPGGRNGKVVYVDSGLKDLG